MLTFAWFQDELNLAWTSQLTELAAEMSAIADKIRKKLRTFDKLYSVELAAREQEMAGLRALVTDLMACRLDEVCCHALSFHSLCCRAFRARAVSLMIR